MSEDEWNDTADLTPTSRAANQPKPNGLGKYSLCSQCGKSGHIARFCPTPKVRNGHRRAVDQAEIWGSGAGVVPGKKAENRGPGANGEAGFGDVNFRNACFKCGQHGHWVNECPQNPFGGFKNNAGGCYKCGQHGHWADKCPENPFRGFKKTEDGCFKCGQEGHWKDECPGDRQNFKRNEDSNKPVNSEIYIPPAILDETLFDNGVESGLNFDKIKEIPVEVTGENAPDPMKGFEECGLRKILYANIRKSHYYEPTPVQRYAIPIIMHNRDMMACAQTGSGKTAAFLIPIIHKLLEQELDPHMGVPQIPEVLIITPTRELAMQITKEGKKFAHGTPIGVMSLYGGTSVSYQYDQLREHSINILVATPGRLSQSIRDGRLSLKHLRYLVLDEADRMLDMGFQSDIDEIVMHPMMPLKTKRQTLMFSATFPDDIQLAAKTYLAENYLFCKVGIIGGACADVEQTFYQVASHEKREKVVDILRRNQVAPGRTEKTLIFVGKKSTADFLASYLSQENVMYFLESQKILSV